MAYDKVIDSAQHINRTRKISKNRLRQRRRRGYQEFQIETDK